MLRLSEYKLYEVNDDELVLIIYQFMFFDQLISENHIKILIPLKTITIVCLLLMKLTLYDSNCQQYIESMHRQLIQQQIQQLTTKSHIEKIKNIDQNTYYITYSPILTQSPYSHLVFIVKIIIPQKYPEQSPFIAFKDKIYHLNIDPISGQVFMPILKDDWSPYLTLSAVFDSLNNLLEQPEVDYAATEILKQQYLDEPQKYAEKVNQMVNICMAQPKQELVQNNQSIAQHVEQVIQFRSQQGEAMDNSNEKDYYIEDQNVSLKKSIQFSQNIDRDFMESPIIDQKWIKIQSEQSKDKEKQAKKQIAQQIIRTNAENQLKSQIKINKIPSKMQKSAIEAIDLQKKEQFDQVQKSLRKSDQLIQILLQGCQSMQNTLKNSSNQRVRKLLQKKLQDQWIMVEELMQMTSKLKQKLFTNLKAQTKNLLK